MRPPGLIAPWFMSDDDDRTCDAIGPLDWLKLVPSEVSSSSDRLGWARLLAARYRATHAAELSQPALTHHWLVLYVRPPDQLDLAYDGVRSHVPPPAGSITVVPAGTPVQWECRG